MLMISSIPQRSDLYLSVSMNTRQIRRQNLEMLRSEFGTVRALAALVETDANYLSQILSEKTKQSMGHELARRFEIALKKPEGWMDRIHTVPNELDRDVEEIGAGVRKLGANERMAVKQLVRTLSEHRL